MSPRQPTINLDKTVGMSSDVGAAPIVENPRLKPMTARRPAPRRIGGKILMMGAERSQPARGDKMEAVPERIPTVGRKALQDQVGVEAGPLDEPTSVRLRLRIERGRITVIGAKAIPGVVAPPERLDYGLAYEIASGDRRVAVGSIPDFGAWRGYPDPEGRPGLEGHHISELDATEVNVRVPQQAFSVTSLPRLRLTLFRMKGQPPAVPLTAEPLAVQFPDQLRPVAELRGIDIAALPHRIQDEMRAAMPATSVRRARSPR
jgi:hypothetical protein